MTNIIVPIPPSLRKYREPLREFFAGMVFKLNKNAHKDTPTKQRVPDIITLLRGELEEFERQHRSNKLDNNALVELHDCSNYAFLAFVALRNAGTQTTREKLIDEYLTVDPKKGRVFAKKTRAGAQYKIGQEVKGATSKGRCFIKLTSRSDYTSIAVPRSHLVWRAHTGKWPTGVIDHINRNSLDDRISNLRDVDFVTNALNKKQSDDRKYPPFVTRYMPSGRQHLKHYGKFVYHRYHRGVAYRYAYFDTPTQAAREGAKRFKQETKS